MKLWFFLVLSYTYCIIESNTSSCLPFATLLPAASELAVGTCLLFIASVSRARLYCRHGIALRGTSCFYRGEKKLFLHHEFTVI